MVLHRSSAWLTQQKRNSKLVATLIVPAAEADSGMSVITSRLLKEWPSLWIPIFPPPPSLSVSDLPPPPPPRHKEKGDVGQFPRRGYCPVRGQGRPFETSKTFLSRKALAVGDACGTRPLFCPRPTGAVIFVRARYQYSRKLPTLP